MRKTCTFGKRQGRKSEADKPDRLIHSNRPTDKTGRVKRGDRGRERPERGPRQNQKSEKFRKNKKGSKPPVKRVYRFPPLPSAGEGRGEGAGEVHRPPLTIKL